MGNTVILMLGYLLATIVRTTFALLLGYLLATQLFPLVFESVLDGWYLTLLCSILVAIAAPRLRK